MCWTVGRLEAEINKNDFKNIFKDNSHDYNKHYNHTLPC